MNMATLYKAERIEGLHEDPVRFPYATLAATLPPDRRDWFAKEMQRCPLWIEGGQKAALRFADRVR